MCPAPEVVEGKEYVLRGSYTGSVRRKVNGEWFVKFTDLDGIWRPCDFDWDGDVRRGDLIPKEGE